MVSDDDLTYFADGAFQDPSAPRAAEDQRLGIYFSSYCRRDIV